jgi:hypothetical protein
VPTSLAYASREWGEDVAADMTRRYRNTFICLHGVHRRHAFHGVMARYVTSDQAIIGDGPPIFDARPHVLEATGNDGRLLRLSDFYSREYVTVHVPRYSNMARGDQVRVRWQGLATYIAPQQTVVAPGDLHFSIPRMEVVDSIGGKVGITFVVMQGTTETTSANFGLSITNQTLTTTPSDPAPARAGSFPATCACRLRSDR